MKRFEQPYCRSKPFELLSLFSMLKTVKNNVNLASCCALLIQRLECQPSKLNIRFRDPYGAPNAAPTASQIELQIQNKCVATVYAGLTQRQCATLPKSIRGFDSLNPLQMFEQKLALVFIVGCHPTSFHETVEWWVFRAREGISRKMHGCPAIGSGKSPYSVTLLHFNALNRCRADSTAR